MISRSSSVGLCWFWECWKDSRSSRPPERLCIDSPPRFLLWGRPCFPPRWPISAGCCSVLSRCGWALPLRCLSVLPSSTSAGSTPISIQIAAPVRTGDASRTSGRWAGSGLLRAPSARGCVLWFRGQISTRRSRKCRRKWRKDCRLRPDRWCREVWGRSW